MLKKIFSVIFCIILIFSVFSAANTVSAYEITEFEITARNGLLVSLDTGEFLYENKIDEKVYPASITKIMTATIILESEKFNPEGKISMSESALKLVLGTGSSVSLFKAGEEFTQLDLLYMVLMSSYGDCTYLAAEYYGGSVEDFVAMMNAKAAELGLNGTHYQNPVGLHNEENYTTVRDTYKLASYAIQNETFKKITSTPRHTITTNPSGKRTLTTTNFLIDANTNYYYSPASGVKTGFTDEAGRCLVSTASYGGYNYMCVLMGCPNKSGRRYEFIESASLYRWAFNNFAFKEIANSKEPICEIPLELSLSSDFVPLYFKESFVSVLPKTADDSTIVVKPKLIAEYCEAPIKKGQVLGTADVIYAEKVIGTVDLVAREDIDSSFLLVIVKHIKNFFKSTFFKVLLGALIFGVIVFILLCVKLNMSKIKRRKVKYIPYNKGDSKHEK